MTESPIPNGDHTESEVIEHEAATTERSAARRLALQVLYELDMTHHPVEDIMEARLQDGDISKKAARYLRRLVTGVQEHRIRLDAIIREYAPEWPLEQLAVIDRNILRMAIYELAVRTTTPVGVIIAEAVELAGLFGAENAPRFVNGVLGALTNNVETIRQQFASEQS